MNAVAMREPEIVLLIARSTEEYRYEKACRMVRVANDGAESDRAEPDDGQLSRIIPPVSGISIATAAQLPALTDQQKIEVKRLSQCLLEKVDQMSPLLDGEKVEEDFFSYLTAPFDCFSASTVLLRRKTNLAELYYIVQNVGVTPQGNLVLQGSALPAPPTMILRGDSGSFAAKMGKSLAGGLASSIGGAIGGLFWDALFPPGVPGYFDEVYKEISKRLRQDAAIHIKGALGNIQNAISAEYRPRKATADLSQEDTRKDLFGLLQKYDTAFLSGADGMMGTLTDPAYAEEAFPIFLLGAGLQLALYQEMAVVDPLRKADKTWPSPLESSYGRPKTGTTALAAARLAGHARETWQNMTGKRAAAITIEEYTYTPFNGISYGKPYRKIMRSDGRDVLEDQSLTYKKKEDNDKLRAAVRSRHYEYFNNTMAKYANQYQNPAESIYPEWEKLIDRPIALAAGA
jgi:hypothetical protein